MRTPYAVALMLTILLSGIYWYSAVEAVCRLPIYYAVGEVDERFGLSRDEVRTVLSEAESIWEEATGRNLMTYDEDATLKINFVFDDRQESALEAERLKSELDSKEAVNEELGETYAELIESYQAEQLAFEDRKEAYERRLNQYNAEVKRYNAEGGAPPAEYDRLQRDKRALDAELEKVNALASELNALSERINEISERGNALIESYNETVTEFNHSYGSGEEFTQGDYQGSSINIYTYKDKNELALVLAHEFGHAMSLDHVENEASIMHYLIGGQPEELTPSSEDLAAFSAVCGESTTYEQLRERLVVLLRSYGVL